MKPILSALIPLALPAVVVMSTAAPAQRAPDSQPVAITLTNHGILPARIPLAAGKAYTLRFANESDRRHDFAVRSFFQDARIEAGDLAKLDKGRVSLAPGERLAIRIIAPRRPGARYEFSSTQLADADSGLKGNIFIR